MGIKVCYKIGDPLSHGYFTCFASRSLEGTGFNVTMATCSFVRPHGDGAKDLKEMVLSLTGSVDRSGFLGKASVRSLMRSSLETSEGIFEIRKVRAMTLECLSLEFSDYTLLLGHLVKVEVG